MTNPADPLPPPGADPFADAMVALVRLPYDQWRSYLTDLHTRAVAACRFDVAAAAVNMLDKIGPPPATPDGTVRSPCVAIACGEAWVAPAGTALPVSGQPGTLAPEYRYAGAVGTRSHDPRDAVPAVVFPDPEPHEVTGFDKSDRMLPPNVVDRVDVEFHDPYLIGDLDNRETVLVVDDTITGLRFVFPRAALHTVDVHAPAGRCSRLRAHIGLYPGADGNRIHIWEPAATPVTSALPA